LTPPYYRAYVEGDLSYIVSEAGGSVWVPDTTNTDRIFDSRLSYAKGSFLLRMLRWTLGDSAFFKGINNYLTDPRLSYGFARTADLQRNLEHASGQNLDYFFKQWFYGEGYPSFKVLWNQDSVTGEVHFAVSEKTSVPLSVDFFKAALPVQLVNGVKTKTVTLPCRYNNQQFTVANPGFKVKSILIDPENYLISAGNKAVKKASLKGNGSNVVDEKPLQAGEILVSPNPVTNVATITLKNIQGKAELKLFNSRGIELWNSVTYIADNSAEIKIPFTAYGAGVYKLVLTDANGSHSSATIVK
jgi:hypothetical protein